MNEAQTAIENGWIRRYAASPWAPAAIIAIGVVLRLGYILIKGPELFLAEASNVAVAVADGRGFADAYFRGSGPTAHLLPTTPLIAGLVMKVFGIRTFASEALLVSFSLAQTVAIGLLLFALFSRLTSSRPAVLGALAATSILPTMFSLESYSFSCWDNGLVFIACLLCLLDQATVWARGVDTFRERLASAAKLAVAVFFNPVLGLALAACLFIVRLTRFNLRSAVATGLLSLTIFALIAAPWAWRNQQVLGSPIFSRSNAGLELAIANHDAALSSRPGEDVFNERSIEIHPFSEGPAREAFKKVGEPAYHNELGRRTREWIAEHPAGFARLALRHMYRTLTPEPWQIGSFAGRERATIITMACWAGLLALGWLLLRRRSRPWWIVALFLGFGLVAYSPFQPMARYIYPFYQLLLFTAFAGAGAWWADRSGGRNAARVEPVPT